MVEAFALGIFIIFTIPCIPPVLRFLSNIPGPWRLQIAALILLPLLIVLYFIWIGFAFVFLYIGFVLLSLMVLILALRELAIIFTIKRLPTARASAAAAGLVEVSGRVGDRMSSPAPLSGVPCNYWEISIQELWEGSTKADDADETVTTDCGGSLTTFDLIDESGAVPVWTYGAEVPLEKEEWRLNAWRLNPWADQPNKALGDLPQKVFSSLRAPDRILSYLRSKDITLNPKNTAGALQVVETRFVPGQPLYVLGTVSTYGDAVHEILSERPMARLLSGITHLFQYVVDLPLAAVSRCVRGFRLSVNKARALALSEGPLAVILSGSQLSATTAVVYDLTPPHVPRDVPMVWRGPLSRPFVVVPGNERSTLSSVRRMLFWHGGLSLVFMYLWVLGLQDVDRQRQVFLAERQIRMERFLGQIAEAERSHDPGKLFLLHDEILRDSFMPQDWKDRARQELLKIGREFATKAEIQGRLYTRENRVILEPEIGMPRLIYATINDQASAFAWLEASKNFSEADRIMIKAVRAQPDDYGLFQDAWAIDGLSVERKKAGYHASADYRRELEHIATERAKRYMSKENQVAKGLVDPSTLLVSARQSLAALEQAARWMTFLPGGDGPARLRAKERSEFVRKHSHHQMRDVVAEEYDTFVALREAKAQRDGPTNKYGKSGPPDDLDAIMEGLERQVMDEERRARLSGQQRVEESPSDQEAKDSIDLQQLLQSLRESINLIGK